MTTRKIVAEQALTLVTRTSISRRTHSESAQVMVAGESLVRRLNALSVQVMRPLSSTASVGNLVTQVMILKAPPFKSADGVHLKRKRDGVFELMFHVPPH